MAFEIHALRVGELYIPHGAGVLRDPVHCWLAYDGKTRILIDSGMPSSDEVRRTLKIDATGGGHTALRDALAVHKLRPEDIEFVVPTHLHFDHGCNLDLFPDACVILQRDELFHAIDSVPTQRIYYRRDTVMELINRKRPSRLRLIDSDLQLKDGFFIMKLPSHTEGMQIPIVTTQRGRAALVSDLGDHYRYWFPADPRASDRPMRYLSDSFLPSPIRVTGEREYLAAMQRVMDNTDIVVPAHDFRVPQHMPREWFAIPESTAGDLGHVPPAGIEQKPTAKSEA